MYNLTWRECSAVVSFFCASTVGALLPQEKSFSLGITVAVHGTVAPSFHLLNPLRVLRDELSDDCLSVRLIQKYRQKPWHFQDQLVSDEGLVEVPYDKIRACSVRGVVPEERSLGSLYILHAYDALLAATGERHTVEQYATFGWLGSLGHKICKKAAKNLYDSLCDLSSWCLKHYGVKPAFTLLGYSRGGHPILYLAYEEMIQRRGLEIENVIFFAVPMQDEVAPYVASPLFKNIISCYSAGDWVQTADRFSPKTRRSYRCMRDILDLNEFKERCPECCRWDIQLVANHRPKRIDHHNVWIMRRSSVVFPWLEPLPIVSLTPLLLKEIKKHPYECHMIACLHGKGRLCIAMKKRCAHKKCLLLSESDDYYSVVQPCARAAKEQWIYKDCSRSWLCTNTLWQALRRVLQ